MHSGRMCMLCVVQLVETYGDVSSLDLGGGNPCVLLSGLRGFREAFVEQAEAFTDRPSYPLNDRLGKGLGNVGTRRHVGTGGHVCLH